MKVNANLEYVDGEKEIRCAYCGKTVQAERTTKFFCNAQCKNRWHAKRERAQRNIALALSSLQTLIDDLPQKGDSDQYDVLVQMKGAITTALNGVEK